MSLVMAWQGWMPMESAKKTCIPPFKCNFSTNISDKLNCHVCSFATQGGEKSTQLTSRGLIVFDLMRLFSRGFCLKFERMLWESKEGCYHNKKSVIKVDNNFAVKTTTSQHLWFNDKSLDIDIMHPITANVYVGKIFAACGPKRKNVCQTTNFYCTH